MPYLPLIPQPGDTLSASQPRILGNFTQLETTLGVNHVPPTDVTANNGKHKWVTYMLQPASPALLANEAETYTKAVGGITQLFFKRFGSASVQMTGPTPVAAQDGYTFLPGGILLQWGVLAGVPNGHTDQNFNVPFSANVYVVTITQESNSGTAKPLLYWTGTPDPVQFGVRNLGPACDIAWTAIGPA